MQACAGRDRRRTNRVEVVGQAATHAVHHGQGHRRVAHREEQPEFVAPHIFALHSPDELPGDIPAGPVLFVIRSDSFDESLRIANTLPFEIGGVYSRKPSNLDRARRELTASSLFLNQSPVGARVARHPRPNEGVGHLLSFTKCRTVSESTMRSGFAPGLD